MAQLKVAVNRPKDRIRRSLQVVDSDVHPYVPGGLTTVLPYMTQAWRRRFEIKGASVNPVALSPRFGHPTNSALRADAAQEEGLPPASDARFTGEDLMDRYGIDYGVLTSLEVGTMASGLAGPDESAVLCTAYNQYLLDHWYEKDHRYRLALCVPSQDPAKAVEEIRHFGKHAGVAAVHVPLINTLLGNRHFFPIYEEAERQGLPILTHVNGTEGIYLGAPGWIQGVQENYAERRCGLPLYGEANLISLVFSGVFQKFPALKVSFVEYGFGWLLPLLWRMDGTWQNCRIEVPWLTEPPSEMLRGRAFFATQPLDDPVNPNLPKYIEMLGAERLTFSTDYPHWDADSPDRVLTSLSLEDQEKIFSSNALSLYRF